MNFGKAENNLMNLLSELTVLISLNNWEIRPSQISKVMSYYIFLLLLAETTSSDSPEPCSSGLSQKPSVRCKHFMLQPVLYSCILFEKSLTLNSGYRKNVLNKSPPYVWLYLIGDMITLKWIIEILLTSVIYCLGYRLSHFHVGKAVLRQPK